MRIRRVAFVLALSLLPAAVHADRHFADVMAGGFKAKGSDFEGWQVSGSWPIAPCIDLSLVGSFGRYKGKEDGDDADHTLATYIIGGRFTHHLKVSGYELQPFTQILWGAVDNIRELDEDLRQVKTHHIVVFGFGIQPAFGRDKPLARGRFRLRLQVDVFNRSDEELGPFKPGGWGAAGSVGLVYQFGPEFECKKNPCSSGPPRVPEKPSAPLVSAERRGPLAPGERIAIGAR